MHESPLPKFSRLIISIYLFGAPTMLMIADGFHYFGHYLIAVVVFKIALVSFVVGSFGLAYMLPDHARAYGLIGTGLVALGAITISAMSTATLFQDLLKEGGYSEAQLKDLESTLENTKALRVIYLPSGFAFPLGLVSLAIGIFRTTYTPNYIAVILIVGAVFHTVARFVDEISLLLISEVILLTASSLTGWFMWRYKK
ncbi:MAG TPA: hypothetical protein VFE50_08470 [Cyclobacteriaceae bacterium]|nr:hypothetical protein [Cyclobacteriaceae bacterium]